MPHIQDYKTLVKLGQLQDLLSELRYELTDGDGTACADVSIVSETIYNTMERLEKNLYDIAQNEKLDVSVYIIVKKIINNNREEIILNDFAECFAEYSEAVSYVINHFRARRCKKGGRFETDNFVYEIKTLPIIKKYIENNDQIILRKEEE